jgi:hypothetical protein
MLFDSSFTTEYEEIRKRKQEASDANTHKGNSKRVKREIQRKLSPKRDGPYQILPVYSGGTFKIRNGI